MKVMYLAFEGFDTQNGTNHLALTMIDEFLNAGMDVYLVSSHSKGMADDIPDIFKNRKGFTYDIINRSIVSKTNFFQRYWDGFRYAFNCMKAWKKHIDSINIIILQSTPTAVFSSILLRWFGKKPVIYNSYDVFPDGPYAMGAITNKLVFKVLQRLQQIVYKNSEKIVVISSDMKYQLQKIGVPSDKLVEIKNWYDDKAIRVVPFDKNKFAKKYQLSKDAFYVQYAGNFGYTFNYKMVLDIAALLKSNKEIIIQMIGDGAFREAFVSEANERGLDNIIFYPWQPLDIISDVYSVCSVELIPLSNGVIWNSFPSKGSLLMACGRVILCATEKESDYYKQINENDVGICVSNKSPEKAASSISMLFKHRERLKEIGINAQEYGRKEYSSSVNVNKFIKLLDEVVNSRTKGISKTKKGNEVEVNV
ncbi:glycosyltransferase family 4 protein [Clostridium sp. UBA871]|uniref:glycosyltransferase family 4 protein n=1 Tax=Clostridium sp. UBA871 TaxID=1946380 RepID=UPI003216AB84